MVIFYLNFSLGLRLSVGSKNLLWPVQYQDLLSVALKSLGDTFGFMSSSATCNDIDEFHVKVSFHQSILISYGSVESIVSIMDTFLVYKLLQDFTLVILALTKKFGS